MIHEEKPPPLPLRPFTTEEATGKGNLGTDFWGGWATAGFALLVMFVFVVSQTVVVLGVAFFTQTPFGDARAIEALGYDADVLSLASIVSAVAVVGLIALLISARGMSMDAYLGLGRPSWWAMGCAVLITPALGFGMDAIARMIQRGPPAFMIEMAQSTSVPVLVAIGVAVAAPIAEEVFFRGFLYRSWRESRLGSVGAGVLSSALWAAIHLQYGSFEIAGIFVLGMAFTVMYAWSDSLWIPVGMHVLNNGISLIQADMLYG